MLRFDPPRHADHVFGGAVVILLIAGGLLTLRRGSPFPVLFALLGLSVLVPWFLSLRSGRFDVFEPIVFHSVFVGMFCVALFGRVYLYGWAWRQDVITYGYVEGFTLYGTALLVTFWSALNRTGPSRD